jgi:signal transduction histidine kinase
VSDITEQKRAVRRPIAQYAVTRVLAEAATLRDAASSILHAVCESAGWEVGVIWSVDQAAAVLRCVDVWCAPGIAAEEFAAASREATFAAGSGLPGRVWARRAPRWIPDILRDTNTARTAFASLAGLHGAFAFPILFGSEASGVIEFYCQEIREPEEDLIAMIDALGSQIGQFMARRHAEKELQAARESAAAATGAGSESVGSVNTEIRTPLSKIIGMSELALRTALNAEQQELLTMIKASADSLLAKFDTVPTEPA